MPHTIEPTNEGDVTSVTVPSDLEPITAASVEAGFQAVANLAAFCRAFLLGSIPGATLLNLELSGTTVAGGPIRGDGTFLFLSQPGEHAIVLGPSIFSATNTHRFDGVLQTQDTALLNGPVQFAGTVTPSGTGHILKRPARAGVTTNHTYTIADGDTIMGDPSAGSIAWTIDGAGAAPGVRMLLSVVRAANTANTITVNDGSGGLIATLQYAAGQLTWVEVEFSGTSGLFFPVRWGSA
jgi:hypothetical protein